MATERDQKTLMEIRKPSFESIMSSAAICSAAQTITSKGLQTLLASSISRNDGLAQKMEIDSPLILHTECRKQYTRPSSIQAAKRKDEFPPHASTATSGKRLKLRSSELEFDFKRECLFCTENVSDNVKLAVDRRKSTSIVRTLEFRDTVVIRATEREDQWGDSLLARVCNTIDLVAVEAK